jgi:hypothetical protein
MPSLKMKQTEMAREMIDVSGINKEPESNFRKLGIEG